ncbi:hypothetical protein ACTFIW_003728, partial [Dictyostelium discoideum]
SLQSH